MLTGKIGIGNITAPLAKLHILGDDDADRPYNASLYIQSAGNYYSTLWLGDQHHFLKTKPDHAFEFNAGGNDFYFNEGNVGIGTTDFGNSKLAVAGNIKTTGLEAIADIQAANILASGNIIASQIEVAGFKLTNNPGINKILQSDETGYASWVEPPPTDDGDWVFGTGNDLYRMNGNVGIGIDEPTTLLDVAGDITGQQINITGLKLVDGNQATGKLLQSGPDGSATWANPPPTDDNDWTFGTGNDLYRINGNVGIGTNNPGANLHIKDFTGNTDKTILKIESPEQPGSGSIEIGRELGNGPVIIQRAGNNNFNDAGPRLSFQQLSRTGQVGLSLSTYTKTTGAIKDVDLVAVNGGLYLRSLHDFHIKAGGNNPMRFYTQCTVGKSTGVLQMEINSDGQVGIGTTTHSDPDTKLTVAGRIHAQEVKVTAGAGTGADFVFEEDYNLPEIADVEAFILANKHLPDIPSAKQMQEEGLDIGVMQIKLLQKIEELTLYVIDLKKENEQMQNDNAEMKAEIEKLKSE